MELEAGRSVILHKHAFLAAEKSATLDVFFNKKVGAGLFGGEGLHPSEVDRPGVVFAELDGDAVEYNLKAGEVMKIEPGHIAMFEDTVSFDFTMVKGITNMLFGGEGLFSRLADRSRAHLAALDDREQDRRAPDVAPAARQERIAARNSR